MNTQPHAPASAAESRAREVLGSVGADTRRWPDAERKSLTGTIAASPILRNERHRALALDAMLDEWAGRDLGGGDARGAAALAMRRPSMWRAVAGGSIAAAVAALLVAGLPMFHATPRTAPAFVPLTDEAAFASVFNPTPDEEPII